MADKQTNPVKGAAYAGWQEPYFAALREQNPFSLPERLVTAEKAILLRMEDLHDAPESLPELQELRKALNSLYARRPIRTPAAPKIVDNSGEYGRRSGTNLVAVAALIAIMSFAMGWILSRKKSGDAPQNAGNTSEPRGYIGDSDRVIASVPEVHILDTPPPVPRALPQGSGAGTSLPSAPDGPKVAENKHSQSEIDKRSSEAAVVKDHDNPSASDRARESFEASRNSTTRNAPSPPVESSPNSRSLGSSPTPPKMGGSAAAVLSDQPRGPSEVPHEPPNNPPPSIAEPRPAAAQPTSAEALGKPAEAQPPISPGSVTVSFSAYPSIRVPPELKSQAIGAKLQIGQVVSRVDPIYPEDVRRQRIEGTVKLHAVIGTDGSVKGIEGIIGPPLLVPAALSAVRQWRYQPTLLGDQPIETGQDVTIVFRLAKDTASAN